VVAAVLPNLLSVDLVHVRGTHFVNSLKEEVNYCSLRQEGALYRLCDLVVFSKNSYCLLFGFLRVIIVQSDALYCSYLLCSHVAIYCVFILLLTVFSSSY
jgi:hypothetical protein